MTSASDGIPYEKFADGKTVDISNEIPFTIPPSWQWVKLKNICDYGSCNNIDAQFIHGDSWMLELEDIEKDSGMISRRILKKDRQTVSTKHKFSIGNVLYSKLRPYLNKVIIADTDGFCSSEIIPMDLIGIYPSYAQIFLMSPFFINYANENSYGVKMPRLGTDEARNAFFAVPPFAEQQRIVAKIEELLPHIERYGKAEAELDELQIHFPEELKKSILQSAIQGKLVPQDPTDESAEVLLERIRAEKSRLIKSGKLKPPKNESTIFRASDRLHYEKCGTETRCIADELPFQIPDSWQWVRFKDIVNYSIGKTPPRKDTDYWSNASIPWVSIADMEADETILTTKEAINDHASSFLFKGRISPVGTLIMSFKLTVGKVSVLGISAYHNEAIISVFPYVDHKKIMTNFLFKLLPLLAQSGKTKSAIKGNTLNSDSIDNLWIPLPPLAEQIRIVTKIEMLLKNIEPIKP